MKKIALFVEGQTEAIFISEMIRQIFGEKKASIIAHNMQYTHNKVRTDTIITNTAKEYYFLIYNCGTDDKVKSNINDNHNLSGWAYTMKKKGV